MNELEGSGGLAGDEVHMWHVRLASSESDVRVLRTRLSSDELLRVQRFHFARDSDRYVVTRGALRGILATYLDRNPAELSFSYGAAGKPELDRVGIPPLRFNLSHAGEHALIAVTWGRRIGVDIERVRPIEELEGVASRFSTGEQEDLGLVPENARQEAFFSCWTRKEAFIKAKGDGLSIPLDSFRVSLLPDRPAQLLAVYSDPEEATAWRLEDIECPEGYRGTLAVEGHDWRIVRRTWERYNRSEEDA